jgi:hypothetical protein
MNRTWVISNLQEAQKELDQTIKDIEIKEDYDYGEFIVAISHLYHHLNTAWNSQNITEEQAINITEEDFYKWRKFPEDIYLGQ